MIVADWFSVMDAFWFFVATHQCENCGGYMHDVGRACGGNPWVEQACVACGRRERIQSGHLVLNPGYPQGL